MTSLLLLGCGNMGSALLSRWHVSKQFSSLHVVDPNPKTKLANVSYSDTLPEKISADVIVLAVKPQQLDDVLASLAQKIKSPVTILSIAAGKTISYYEKYLGQGAAIVRAMPNTPAMIGEGITALVGSQSLTKQGRDLATTLIQAVGEVVWLEDEKLMDAVTAISGSGPAYIYYIIECMVAAGVKHGLTVDAARMLAAKTCEGAAALALGSPASLAELRRQVTSPGGTTEAGLGILMKDGIMQNLIDRTVEAAVKRAQELA